MSHLHPIAKLVSPTGLKDKHRRPRGGEPLCNQTAARSCADDDRIKRFN
jgi:hypothetical protein